MWCIRPYGAATQTCIGGSLMASIFKQKDTWHVKFYLSGAAYRKSLGTASEHKARRAKQRLEGRLADLKAGFLKLPEGADVAEYLVRGHVVRDEQVEGNAATFEDMLPSYLEHAEARRARSSFATERVHIKHFERFLNRRVRAPVPPENPVHVSMDGLTTSVKCMLSGVV